MFSSNSCHINRGFFLYRTISLFFLENNMKFYILPSTDIIYATHNVKYKGFNLRLYINDQDIYIRRLFVYPACRSLPDTRRNATETLD